MSQTNCKSKKHFQAILANQSLDLQRDKEALKQLENSLVNREQMNADIQRLHDQIETTWRQWPKVIAAEIATRMQAEPKQVEALLQKYMDEQLNQFAADIPTL